MKKEKQNIGIVIVLGIRSFFIYLGVLIESLWSFMVNNLGRIIKIVVTAWILILISILTLALSYWLLGLGSKYFIETGKELETLELEKLVNKYPDLQISLGEVLIDEDE